MNNIEDKKLKSFNIFQTHMSCVKKDNEAATKINPNSPTRPTLDRSTMSLIGYYSVTPTTFESTLDLIDFLVSTHVNLDTIELNNIKKNLQEIFANRKELTREAANASIEVAMESIKDVIRNHSTEILFEACKKAKQHVILGLLSLPAGFDVNVKNMSGDTPLILAARKEYKEVVALLLEKGAPINEKNYRGWTALMYAASSGRQETVALLLKNGASINENDSSEFSALSLAAWNGHKDTVILLLENGAKINNKDHDGWSALMFAAYSGHQETVALLLESGANINEKNKNGLSALMLAANGRHKEIAVLLGKEHQRQFYVKAITSASGNLELLLNEDTEAKLTRDAMCQYLLDLVDQEPQVHQKIALLKGALGDHAFGALLRETTFFSWERTSPAVTKIERVITSLKPAEEVLRKTTVTMQYTVPRNTQPNPIRPNVEPSL